jgi:hypothetical protein
LYQTPGNRPSIAQTRNEHLAALRGQKIIGNSQLFAGSAINNREVLVMLEDFFYVFLLRRMPGRLIRI